MSDIQRGIFSDDEIFIVVSGIIGAGKSTLTRKISDEMNIKAYYEPVKENAYLKDFYANIKAEAFKMQVYLLNKRFKQHQEIIWSSCDAIQDRSIYEDRIFAHMLYKAGMMSKRDFDTYRELSGNMTKFLRQPDVIVYLNVTPEVAHSRVMIRADEQKEIRECEHGITLEYLSDLRNNYEEWLKDINKKIPVVRIDWNNFGDTKDVVKKIKECLNTQRPTALLV